MMRIARRLLVIGVVVVMGSTASAGARGLPIFNITPTSGPVGATVTAVSGTPCPAPQQAASTYVRVNLWSKATRIVGRSEHSDVPVVLASGFGSVQTDGTWTATFTVPATARPGRHAVEAHCWANWTGGGTEPYFDYEDVTFRVR